MTNTAIIDLGTNTFHLLVANESKKILHEEKMPVRMGVGGINDGLITVPAIQRIMECLHGFARKCREMHVKKIRAFGTSAFRNAKNGNMLIEKIKKETGIDIQVISGEEEAQLIYVGVRNAVALGKEKSLIVDIGGGSVEFIIANEEEIFWKQSIEIGGQRLFEKFHRHEPILNEELGSLRKYLRDSLIPVVASLQQFKPTMIVGSSGSFETLSDIYCVRRNIPNTRNPESPLNIESFHAIYDDLKVMNKVERIAMPGMMEWRAEMIVVTCTLIDVLVDMHAFQHIAVSRYSLKEGALFSD